MEGVVHQHVDAAEGAARAAATSRAQSSGFVMSVGTAIASAPAARTSASAFSSLPGERAASASFAPSRAKASEMSRPMPGPMPETIATLFCEQHGGPPASEALSNHEAPGGASRRQGRAAVDADARRRQTGEATITCETPKARRPGIRSQTAHERAQAAAAAARASAAGARRCSRRSARRCRSRSPGSRPARRARAAPTASSCAPSNRRAACPERSGIHGIPGNVCGTRRPVPRQKTPCVSNGYSRVGESTIEPPARAQHAPDLGERGGSRPARARAPR